MELISSSAGNMSGCRRKPQGGFDLLQKGQHSERKRPSLLGSASTVLIEQPRIGAAIKCMEMPFWLKNLTRTKGRARGRVRPSKITIVLLLHRHPNAYRIWIGHDAASCRRHRNCVSLRLRRTA